MTILSFIGNKRVYLWIGIMACLLLVISIIMSLKRSQVVLEQTKTFCQELKSIGEIQKDLSLEKKHLEIKNRVIKMDHLLHMYPLADYQLTNVVTRYKELFSHGATLITEILEHKSKYWTTFGQSVIALGAGFVSIFRGNFAGGYLMEKGMQTVGTYDEKGRALKDRLEQLSIENKSLEKLSNQVNSFLRETYEITECVPSL